MTTLQNGKLSKDMLFGMMRIRMIEEAIADRYSEQEMRCPVHLCIGQEAIAVGVCANLDGRDYVLSAHRSHGHFLAKGGDLKAMLAELYGRATGCSGGKGGSMHLVDLACGFLGATPIVGSTIPIAVGVALTAQMRRESRVAVSFFGDAAVEEGVFHEALNFAALKKLPVVFVCENNLYSVYSDLSVRQPSNRELFELAAGHGVPSFKGDGNDVFAVYEIAHRAVNRARGGGGPTFLDLTTYRWREHCGPYYDHEFGHRTETELEAWKARCPVSRLQDDLRRRAIISDADIREMLDTIRSEIEEAFLFARQSPYPPAESLGKDIFAG